MAKETQIKSLILTESAGKARALKKFVGHSYSVISTEGFLKNLPKSRIGIDEHYVPDYITVRGQGALLKELKDVTMQARRIFLAMNPDAQGEFLAKQCCQLFGLNEKSNCRLVFDELTKLPVKEALTKARPIDENLVDAFQTRQIIDKYVSHKVGEYLSCKIYRGVKVGRFRALLLKLVDGEQLGGEYDFDSKLTLGTLQALALREFNFSTPKTLAIVEQLYEGLNFAKEGYIGLIKYPNNGDILLTSEARTPENVKQYLTDNQFKLYDLIYAQVTANKFSARVALDGSCNHLALMAKLTETGIDWAKYYAKGISSLLRREYVVAEETNLKVTGLGKKILEALSGFFDEVFCIDSYNKVAAQIHEVAEGKAAKQAVIENYCAEFNKSFEAAMESLGENARPQEEPVTESNEVCDKCGRPMLIRRGRYGMFLACSGYPECKNAKPIVEYLAQKCPKCGRRLTRQEFGRGRYAYGCENYPECDFRTWDTPAEKSCSECGSTMFFHSLKNRASMFYCGNENCPTRSNHPINRIIETSRKRAETRKLKKQAESN